MTYINIKFPQLLNYKKFQAIIIHLCGIHQVPWNFSREKKNIANNRLSRTCALRKSDYLHSPIHDTNAMVRFRRKSNDNNESECWPSRFSSWARRRNLLRSWHSRKSAWKRALDFMTKYAMKNRRSESIKVLKRSKNRFILETSVQVVS